MSGVGHNNGPAIDRGVRWRRHCWSKARASLIPHLPIEILRGRVKRARELGLDYSTYASVRASTGHNVIGFLFSSNALRSFVNSPDLPEDRAVKLLELQSCKRIALVSHPLTGAGFQAANPELDITTFAAPLAHASWSAARKTIQSCILQQKLPADGVLLIGDTALEQEWSTAGRLAGYLSAERYFQAINSPG